MSVTTVWLDDGQSILGYVIEGNWTWDEMHAAVHQANALMDTISHQVDFIVDMRHGGLIPSDVFTNIRQLAVSVPPHPNYGGTTVFVEANTLVRTLMNMVSNIFRQLKQYHTFMFAVTIEEAYTVIAEQRARRRSA